MNKNSRAGKRVPGCSCLLTALLLSLSAPGISAEADIEALFGEGMEALEEQRLRTAIDAFNQILSSDPRLHRARLELALAYYRSFQFAEAERFAQEVLDDPNTPDSVRVTVLAFLAQVRSDAEKAAQKHQWQPRVSVGYMYDSNATVGPTSREVLTDTELLILTDESLKKSDHARLLSAGMSHSYRSAKTFAIGERIASFLWQSDVSLYHRDYKQDHDLNLSVVTLSTGPSWIVPKHWRAGVQLAVDYLELGSEELATFTSLRPVVTWQFDQTELTWDATYTDRTYEEDVDSGREGDYFKTGVSVGQYYQQRKVAAQTGVSYLYFDAEDDQFGYDGYEAFLGASVRAWQHGNVYARFTFRAVEYDADTILGATPAGVRDEDEFRLLVGMTHQFQTGPLADWQLGLNTEYTRNDSNVSAYEYERTQIAVNLSHNF